MTFSPDANLFAFVPARVEYFRTSANEWDGQMSGSTTDKETTELAWLVGMGRSISADRSNDLLVDLPESPVDLPPL